MPYSNLGAPIGSLLIGASLPLALNRIWGEKEQNAKSYTGFSDYFGLLFFRAQLKKKPVLISLRNGKVYIGLVYGCNTPGKHDGGGSVYIQPTLSGYRLHVTHEMYITTDYTAILQDITAEVEEGRRRLDEAFEKGDKNEIADHRGQLRKKEKAAEERLDDLKLAVSVSDIVSSVVFDKSVYGQFNPMFKS